MCSSDLSLVRMFGKFYSGKAAWGTGHTGFKGAWLRLWLRDLGAHVHGFALEAHAPPNIHETLAPNTIASETSGDIGDFDLVKQAAVDARPDIVFHLAAQPLVGRSYVAPLETATTNILGTAHVLEALRENKNDCPVVVVTSDKCYENDGASRAFTEVDPPGGPGLYSASKSATGRGPRPCMLRGCSKWPWRGDNFCYKEISFRRGRECHEEPGSRGCYRGRRHGGRRAL